MKDKSIILRKIGFNPVVCVAVVCFLLFVFSSSGYRYFLLSKHLVFFEGRWENDEGGEKMKQRKPTFHNYKIFYNK